MSKSAFIVAVLAMMLVMLSGAFVQVTPNPTKSPTKSPTPPTSKPTKSPTPALCHHLKQEDCDTNSGTCEWVESKKGQLSCQYRAGWDFDCATLWTKNQCLVPVYRVHCIWDTQYHYCKQRFTGVPTSA